MLDSKLSNNDWHQSSLMAVTCLGWVDTRCLKSPQIHIENLILMTIVGLIDQL